MEVQRFWIHNIGSAVGIHEMVCVTTYNIYIFMSFTLKTSVLFFASVIFRFCTCSLCAFGANLELLKFIGTVIGKCKNEWCYPSFRNCRCRLLTQRLVTQRSVTPQLGLDCLGRHGPIVWVVTDRRTPKICHTPTELDHLGRSHLHGAEQEVYEQIFKV